MSDKVVLYSFLFNAAFWAQSEWSQFKSASESIQSMVAPEQMSTNYLRKAA